MRSSQGQTNKPHIALYIGSLNKGGAERVLVNLAEYLYQAGWTVTFVTTYVYPDEFEVPHAAWTVTNAPGPEGEGGALNSLDEQVTASMEANGRRGICRVLSGLTDAETSGLRLLNIFRRMKKLARTFRTLGADVVLSFLGKNNIMALQCGGIHHIPVVVSVRSNPAREYAEDRLHRQMLRLFPRAAAVVLQTNEAVEYFPENIRQRAVVLPNSVNPVFLEPNDRIGQNLTSPAQTVQNMASVASGQNSAVSEGVRNTIITVGRLDSNKNQQLVIRAFAAVHPQFPDWSLVIYGDGPQMAEDQALATELGIAEAVTFTGAVDGIRDRIALDGIFVLPSRQEGMPNALIEAMALGLPCISTDCPCGGPRDLIRDHENGILIPVDDQNALERALRELMVNQTLAERLGQAASHDMRAYAPEIVNQRWEEVLLKCI